VRVEGLLVGGGDPAAVLAAARAAGLDGAVRVIPSVPNSEIPSLLREMDVFVIPSEQEGLCIAGLEALASGCPVVSTRCGGPEEYVQDGRTGTLVGGEPEEMADAISSIVEDRARRSTLAEGARQLSEERYSPAIARRIFLEALEGMMYRRN
jgi:glycosyltransferase involved in cell wall biosynthesis